MALQAFYGTVFHSVSVSEIEQFEKALLVVNADGKIVVFEKKVSEGEIDNVLLKNGIPLAEITMHRLKYGQFIMPGLIDTHNHAPQWTQRGVGRGIPLLSWLTEVTFAHEARYANPDYAQRTYTSCVDGFIRQGVTTACYYGSLHGEATKILATICHAKGQRAFVGKCNMDQHAVDFYTDASAEESLEVTRDFISFVRNLDPEGKLVQPILTPRFAISCSHDLLTGLGHIAQEDQSLMIQTHFNEAPDEIAFTKVVYPQFTNEVDLFSHYNLLCNRSVLAHAIFNTEYEFQRLAELDVGISHCPISNITIPTFMAAPIRHYFSRGMLKVGLGTDSGGGFSSSIIDAMRQAFIVSNARQTYHSPGNAYSQFQSSPPHVGPNNKTTERAETESSVDSEAESPLSLAECFYLATLGGARVCNLEDKIGSFAVGKEFDALIIHMPGIELELESQSLDQATTRVVLTASTPIEADVDDAKVVWEKFMMSGDDRNVQEVWVRGRRIK